MNNVQSIDRWGCPTQKNKVRLEKKSNSLGNKAGLKLSYADP